MNGYVCFYNNRRIEVYAETQLKAREQALAEFKPPRSKRHMVSVVLAEKDGKQVTHTPDF